MKKCNCELIIHDENTSALFGKFTITVGMKFWQEDEVFGKWEGFKGRFTKKKMIQLLEKLNSKEFEKKI